MRRILSQRDRRWSISPSTMGLFDIGRCRLTFETRPGGVSIVGTGGRIDINNTLDERLKLLETDALPMIRTTLFGKNENRRFYD